MKGGEKNKVRSWKEIFLIDATIALIVLTLPFLIFIHLLFDPLSKEYIILGQTINHGFPDNQVFIWYILNSIIAFAYLILLFITSYGKWRFLLLPCACYFPCNLISMYAVLDSNSYWDYMFSIPGIFSMLMVVSIILLFDNLFKKHILTYYIEITFYQMIREIVFSWNTKLNYQIKSFIKKKPTFSLREYLIRAYYLQEMAEQLKNEGREDTSDLNVVKTLKKKSSIFFTVVIVMTTVFFFLEGFLPRNSKTLNIGGLVIESYGFEDVTTLVWYTSQKAFLVSALIIWFITSPYWWRWAILSPLIFYTYQFWEAFQPETQIESAGTLNVFPLVFATITLVLLISRIVRTHSITMDYKALLERELDHGITELSNLKNLSLKK
ncbi:hypothetical protein [Robiginitalea marina]|uniref:ABC transporter permease n=1 Tax=Robiginitalea marina TaxID=2954105 RepID=A0ABT1AV83_9FLAO|nr:hypothetical protein [Robiginitalea marina]MCO5723584.1 hypothetical protein [Robiginitalea marina]